MLKEAALLYETGGYQKLDYMIVVDTPLELRVQPNEKKVAKADFVLLNDENNMLIQQVLHVHEQLLDK